MKTFDLVIKNARVVRPNNTGVDCLDIAIKDGKVVGSRRKSGPRTPTRYSTRESCWPSPAVSTRTCMSASTGRLPRMR